LTKFEIFINISEKAVSIPFSTSFAFKSLIKGLLEKKDDKRFAYDDIEKHAWLKGVNWDDLDNRYIIPPWIPTADTALVNTE
jgi:hypothetical protein